VRIRAYLALFLLLPSLAFAAITLHDDAGQNLNLPRHPHRIISLAPHVTELIYAVGAGAQLIGADTASDYPASAQKLPHIGDSSRVNFERVAALKPDLIIGWASGNRASDVYKLKQMGIPVLLTDAHQLADVARLLRLVGQATAHASEGEYAARAFENRLSRLRAQNVHTPTRRVFYQVWDKPLMTIGGKHWINDAITLCGGRNIFADLNVASPIISLEAVVARAPEIIVSSSDAPDTRPMWQRFPRMPAVQRHALVRINADTLHRPTSRVLDGVSSLCDEIKRHAQ
jgi:iron complex transport system substrate-binding protein